MSQMKERAQSTNCPPKMAMDNAPQVTLSKVSVVEALGAEQELNITDAEEAIDTAIKLIRSNFDYAARISGKLYGAPISEPRELVMDPPYDLRMKCNFLRELIRGLEVALDEINNSL